MGRHNAVWGGRGSDIRLRLQRMGQRHKAYYRIVACMRWAPRDGKFLEIIGTYNPIPDANGNKKVTLKVDSIKKWIRHGAEPSMRVAKLLGVSEILPPAPRRGLAPQLSLLELMQNLPAPDAEGDADGGEDGGAEDGGEDGGDAASGADGVDAPSDGGDAGGSSTQPEQQASPT